MACFGAWLESVSCFELDVRCSAKMVRLPRFDKNGWFKGFKGLRV